MFEQGRRFCTLLSGIESRSRICRLRLFGPFAFSPDCDFLWCKLNFYKWAVGLLRSPWAIRKRLRIPCVHIAQRDEACLHDTVFYFLMVLWSVHHNTVSIAASKPPQLFCFELSLMHRERVRSWAWAEADGGMFFLFKKPLLSPPRRYGVWVLDVRW